MKNLEGCQYSICCHNDEYQELKKELSQLQQEKEELIKWLEEMYDYFKPKTMSGCPFTTERYYNSIDSAK